MNAVGLPARIGYAIVALPAGGAAGFYSTVWLLPKLERYLLGGDPGIDEYRLFLAAVGVGAGLAFTAFLIALTLPWKRRRRRGGRGWRIVASCVVVLLASLAFAGQGHALIYDLAFAGWLAYVTAYTFVRYGVLDRARRSSASDADSDPVDSE
jgi:hypothetical protein